MTRWSAVFLDRDGTLNVKPTEGDYVRRADQLTLLPDVADAVGRLAEARVPIFVVTNQRGVAQGLMTTSALDAVHLRLRSLLAQAGAVLQGIYSCTHDIGECECRKPLPGLLHQAAWDYPELDLTRCGMVGDAASDIAAGIAVGCATTRLANVRDPTASVTVRSLGEAVNWLLR